MIIEVSANLLNSARDTICPCQSGEPGSSRRLKEGGVKGDDRTVLRKNPPIHFPMQRTDPVQRSRPKQERKNNHDEAAHQESGQVTALI